MSIENIKNITILDCSQDHKELLFKWVNDKEVRSNSLNSEVITWDNHVVWFEKKMHSVDSTIFIGLLNQVPFGQVRFDFSDKYYHIDYSVDQSFRGKGLASTLLELCFQKLKKKSNKEVIFLAYVKKSNLASIKVFQKLNFNELTYGEDHELRLFTLKL